MISLAVAAAEACAEAQAQILASKLDLPLLATGISPRLVEAPEAILYAASSGLYLQQTGRGAPGPVTADFDSAAMRHRRRAGQNELLGRGVGVGKKAALQVLDATAGLGRDAFVLADLGCSVLLCERHPLVFELLASALAQARLSVDPWLVQVAARMALHGGDVRLLDLPGRCPFDVIYLDPMFPARSKGAGVKKEMALFQSILGDTQMPPDNENLLLWALDQSVARVVVKRPRKALPLARREPSHAIVGKSVRYDVYVLGALN